MNITGMIRVRNGERWIRACINSMLPVCQNVVVMDDNSSDETINILNSIPQVHWIRNPFDGLNEARDKTVLLATIRLFNRRLGGWVINMDADEILMDHERLIDRLRDTRNVAFSYRIVTLWDSPDQQRVDGIYQEMWRPAIFRIGATDGVWDQLSLEGPNLHCGSIPTDLRNLAVRTDPEVRVVHFGSLEQADRIAKYHYYRQVDTQHMEDEDYYRHSVQGDVPQSPAEAVFRHGGPLRLERWAL